MRTKRIFKSGNSQAVRLPKDLRFNVGEVEILRRRGEIVLRATLVTNNLREFERIPGLRVENWTAA